MEEGLRKRKLKNIYIIIAAAVINIISFSEASFASFGSTDTTLKRQDTYMNAKNSMMDGFEYLKNANSDMDNYINNYDVLDNSNDSEAQLPWDLEMNKQNAFPRSLIGNAAVIEAREWIGKTPYVWGGLSLEKGADCSGFIVQIYKKLGVDMSANRTDLRNTYYGVNIGTSLSSAEPGDIITWKYESGSHVAIYSGLSDGRHKMVHALNAKYNTVETDAASLWVRSDAYISAITRIKNPKQFRSSVWIPDGSYRIMSISGKYIDAADDAMENEGMLNLWEYADVNNQVFHFESSGDNHVTITPLHDFNPLEVGNSGLENGADITRSDDKEGDDFKKWYLIDAGDGYYSIVNKNSGQAMAVLNSDFSDGAQIGQQEINFSDAQKFRLINVQ